MSAPFRISSSQHELFYHCVTRVVAGEFLFHDREKEVFCSIMQKVAAFCGIEILTFCVMSNHIHILCRVPPADSTEVSDQELVRRYRLLFSDPSQYRPYNPDVLEQLLQGNSARGQKARKLLLNRMHNISMFMKILKLRMSIWFNRSYGRFGTLWAEKFKSIVVEGRGNPLLCMAQYIDLNPVRAGVTSSAASYAYCGIAAATNGASVERKGIETIAALSCPTLPARDAVSWYQSQLEVTFDRRPGSAKKQSEPAHQVNAPHPFLMRNERLSKSLAMGSREFIAWLMDRYSSSFAPRTHTRGPCKSTWANKEAVFFGRDERPRKQ